MNSASVAVVPSVPIIDNELVLSGTVKNCLEWADMSAQICGDGLAASNLVRATAPDVVVPDLGLPGMGGIEVCCRLRAFSDYYVLILMARADEVGKLIGLSTGADDYMTEPFNPCELVARTQVLLRRLHARSTGATAAVVHRIGALILDLPSCQVRLDASPAGLTHTEFDLLQVLVKHPGWVLNCRQLTDAVWDEGWTDGDRPVDVRIAHLRKKLGDDPPQPWFMQAVHDVGYRMGQGQ